jgi:hypothetical protein
MPTTRRSKRARADTTSDTVSTQSSGVEAGSQSTAVSTRKTTRITLESANQPSTTASEIINPTDSQANARPKRIRVMTKKAASVKTAAPAKKAAPKRPATEIVPTKKAPPSRIVVRKPTTPPFEIPQSEYIVDSDVEELQLPAPGRAQQPGGPRIVIRESTVIPESHTSMYSEAGNPFDDDDVVVTSAQSIPPRSTPKSTPKRPLKRISEPPPPPLPPKAVFVKIQRDVKWFRNQYLATFKIPPPVPSRYLCRKAIPVDVTAASVDEPFDGFSLQQAVGHSYANLIDDVPLLVQKAGLEGSVALISCQVHLSKQASQRKNQDITIFNVAPRSPSSVGYIDFDSLMTQMVEAGGTEFELTLEFEFELAAPSNNDDIVVGAAPSPIYGISTPTPSAFRTPSFRSGRPGTQMPRAASAALTPNRGTSKAPSTRKSTSNTMLADLLKRHEADIEMSREQGAKLTRLLYVDLHNRWKCGLGVNCKNYRNGMANICCWRDQGDKKHHQLTNAELSMWVVAIREGRTTIENPPVAFHRKWRQEADQERQQQQETSNSGVGQPFN